MWYFLLSYLCWFIISLTDSIQSHVGKIILRQAKERLWRRFVLDPKMSRILMMNHFHSKQLKCFVWPLQTSPIVAACFPHFLKMLFMEHRHLFSLFFSDKNQSILLQSKIIYRRSSNLNFFQPWWNFKETTGSSIYWDKFVMLWWWSVGSISGVRSVIRLEDDQSWRLPGSDPLGLFSVVMILWCLLTKLRCQ